MRIYTAAKKCCDGIDVGVIVVENKNDIRLATAFKVADNKEYEGHLMGIRRGLSFAKNVGENRQLDNIICIFDSPDYDWINIRLREDRYLHNLKKYLKINILTKKPEMEDKLYLLLAEQQYLMKYKNLENYKGR